MRFVFHVVKILWLSSWVILARGKHEEDGWESFSPLSAYADCYFPNDFPPWKYERTTCTSEHQCSEIHWDAILSVVDRNKIYQYKTADALLQKRKVYSCCIFLLFWGTASRVMVCKILFLFVTEILSFKRSSVHWCCDLHILNSGSICMSTPFRIKSWWNLLLFHRHLIRLVQLWSCLDFIFSIFGSFNFHNIHEILSRLSTAAKRRWMTMKKASSRG